MDTISTKWAPIVVSSLVILVFGVAFCLLAFKVLPDNQSVHDLLIAMFAQVQAVVCYWLGSSAGSKAKDAIIAKSPPVVQ